MNCKTGKLECFNNEIYSGVEMIFLKFCLLTAFCTLFLGTISTLSAGDQFPGLTKQAGKNTLININNKKYSFKPAILKSTHMVQFYNLKMKSNYVA